MNSRDYPAYEAMTERLNQLAAEQAADLIAEHSEATA